MHKLLFFSTILSSILLFGSYNPVSTTSVVTVVGAHIKAKDVPIITKYNRKDCPVCKGKGWYISGDGIEKVACGYCEIKPQTK